MQNVKVRFVMIELLEIRPYNLLVHSFVPTQRILLLMMGSSTLCIWSFHYHALRLILKKKSVYELTNLHKVIKLVNNKEL